MSLPILAGILIGTSYIPFPPWASLFCFVPLWRAWQLQANKQAQYKKIFLTGWIAQFTLTLIGFNWITLTVHEFGHMPWPVAIIVLLFFCGVANLDIPLTGILWLFLHRRFHLTRKTSLVVMALLTALLESWVPTLFPWNYGYPWLWVQFPIAQLAEWVGFQGLSSLIILGNLGFFFFWESWISEKTPSGPRTRRKALQILLVTMGVFIALNLCGAYLKMRLPQNNGQFIAQITQANIGNLEKEYAERGWGFRQSIFSRYANLARESISQTPSDSSHQDTNNNTDFMVWPETAYPYELDQRSWSDVATHYPPAAQNLLQLTGELNTPLITGGYGFSPKDGKVTNTFFIVEKDGRIQPHPYYKTILLAFGEYIPGADFYPKVKDWIPAGDFSHGPGPQVQTLFLKSGHELKIGPQICYESLFPGFSRQLANQGAEVLINLTNDSWYGTWQEPFQHLYMTLGRAVEYRRPLVRSTNTGISTVVLATGEVLQKSPLAKEWTGIFAVPYRVNPPATLYQLYPWLTETLLVVILLLLIGRSYFERSKKSRVE